MLPKNRAQRFYSARDLRAVLRTRIGTDRPGRPPDGIAGVSSQKAIASQLGVSHITLNQFLKGHHAKPPRNLLTALGFEPQPYWRKKQ